MDVHKSIQQLKATKGTGASLNKEATGKNLFPKLKGPNNPPTLTSSSQPKIETNPIKQPKLPKMRVNGSKPKMDFETNDSNPYQKK